MKEKLEVKSWKETKALGIPDEIIKTMEECSNKAKMVVYIGHRPPTHTGGVCQR